MTSPSDPRGKGLPPDAVAVVEGSAGEASVLDDGVSGLLLHRLRVGLLLMLVAVGLFGLGELILERTALGGLAVVKLLQAAVVGATFLYLRRPRSRAGVIGAALFSVGAQGILAAFSNVLRGDISTTPLLSMVFTMGTAVMLPWGVGPQAALVAVAGLSWLANVYLVTGGLEAAVGYPAITMALVLGASLYVASEVERTRLMMLRQTAERVRADAALRRSEQHFRSLIEHAADLITVFETDGTVSYASPSHERVLGLRPEALVGDRALSLVHEDDRPTVTAAFVDLVRNPGVASSIEMRLLRRPDLCWRVVDAVGMALADETGHVRVIINARDITDRQQAEHRTKVLLEIARTVSGALDVAVVFERVQERVIEALPCDWIAIFRMDEEKGVSRLASQRGLPPEFHAALKALVVPAGAIFGGNLGRGESLVANDMAEQSWLPRQVYEYFGIAGLIASPIRVRDRHLGALVVFNTPASGRFDADQVELCAGIARQLGVALESIEIFQSQREETETFAALARVGRVLISSLDRPVVLDRLCQVTAEVLDCDYSYTLLWQAETDTFVPVAAYGHPSEQLEELRIFGVPRDLLMGPLAPLEESDVLVLSIPRKANDPWVRVAKDLDIAGALCIALRRGGKVIGVHCACRRAGAAAFTRRQEHIGRGIAQLASLALENARLFEELQGASRLKSEFVATMSHELRTPLNIIIGYDQLLREGAFGPLNDEQSAAVQRIERSGAELLDLVNATLDLSRLEAGRLPLNLGTVDLSRLLAEVAAETEGLAKRAVELSWNLPAGLPCVRTDGAKIKVVLKNLIGNAMKFTDAGSVTVSAIVGETDVEFDVTDTGIGIAADVMPIIFEPFRQADGSATRRHAGVGLGLYITRRLVDLLGGRVEVSSELGHGSKFVVRFPLVAAPQT